MPHVNSGGGGDDFNNDEVKVFKDEGEVEKNSSENLNEEKSDLIDLTESQDHSTQAVIWFCVAPLGATTQEGSSRNYFDSVLLKINSLFYGLEQFPDNFFYFEID
ncbi:hypothetical protein RUM44_004083 [Polyplax serrata]|uniref:Uncharacterized protein n=1 Tax=Polyplax serrata TaxID=468196 RepID=A0ABR1B1T5_POLSC